VQLPQLLGRQGRSKIGVPLANDSHGGLSDLSRRSAVAGSAALLRDQAISADGAVGVEQAPDVALAEAEDAGSG
jgi:hypothetical protein